MFGLSQQEKDNKRFAELGHEWFKRGKNGERIPSPTTATSAVEAAAFACARALLKFDGKKMTDARGAEVQRKTQAAADKWRQEHGGRDR